MQTGRRTGKIASKPYRAQQAREERALPSKSVRPNTPFTLFFCDSWRFIDGHGWLTCLGELWHKPGCNGVDKDGNPQAAIAMILAKGHIPIDPKDSRLPPEYQDFVAQAPVQGGGWYYSLRCVEWVFTRGGREARPIPDHDWYVGFHEALYSAGIIPPMEAEAFDDLCNVQHEVTRRDAKLVDKGHMTPEAAAARLVEREAMLADWRGWFDFQFADGPRPAAKAEPTATLDIEAEIQARIDAAVTAALATATPARRGKAGAGDA